MSFGFDESRVSMGQQMYRHDAILNTKNILSITFDNHAEDFAYFQYENSTSL